MALETELPVAVEETQELPGTKFESDCRTGMNDRYNENVGVNR